MMQIPHPMKLFRPLVLAAALLIPSAAVEAKETLRPTHWLGKHQRLARRVRARLGAKLSTFIRGVSAAKIGDHSKKWLLRFAAKNPRALAAIAPMEQAHAMDAKGGMERFFAKYAVRFAKTGPTPPKQVDAKLEAKGKKVRHKLAKVARKMQLPALLVMVDGPDGAGKSSTIREVGQQLRGPCTVLEHVARLGAPDPSLPLVQWVEKQLGIQPGKPLLLPGQVLFTDRSLLGNLVYGANNERTAAQIARIESHLKDAYGITVVHIVARPSRERVQQTYGKRLAYGLYEDQLATPKPHVSSGDIPAYQRLAQVTRGFEQAAKRFSSNTLLVDASDRHAYRRKVLHWLGKQLVKNAR